MRITKLLLLSLSILVFAGCSNTAGANTKEEKVKQLEQEKEDLQTQLNELKSKNEELNEKFNSFTKEYEKQRNAAYNHELYQFNTTSQVIFQAMIQGDVAALKSNTGDNIEVASNKLTIANPEGKKLDFSLDTFQSGSFTKDSVIVLKQFSHSENYNHFNMTYAVRSTKENPEGDYYLYLTYSKNQQGKWTLSNISMNP
ncbi:hypothetical protein [Pontibacillus marinus]|uniref:Uncharacterized protein n=1 Tax=Pontibacillus marinus BH030004 = DSM 16465 TaxID=1385511 RepID=A0A0A5G8L5_9BACI|nr:hypothetical protein [Pontibacillus marinus]KGX87460.1 hypothetical protein N783_09690 [Pontibacillus marinus BH030004 = DSM 16465]